MPSMCKFRRNWVLINQFVYSLYKYYTAKFVQKEAETFVYGSIYT